MASRPGRKDERFSANTPFRPIQLPLSLLNAAQGKPMVRNSCPATSHSFICFQAKHVAYPLLLQLVELKNGETYNGHMIACDNFMNVTLRDVILTSPEGDKFYQMKEVYLKGNVVSTCSVVGRGDRTCDVWGSGSCWRHLSARDTPLAGERPWFDVIDKSRRRQSFQHQ
jgi:hypothetical protein